MTEYRIQYWVKFGQQWHDLHTIRAEVFGGDAEAEAQRLLQDVHKNGLFETYRLVIVTTEEVVRVGPPVK